MQQRRRRGAVHVVVAEHGDRSRRPGSLRTSRSAAASMSRRRDGIRQQVAQGRIEEAGGESRSMPRAAIMRPTISGTDSRCASARPSRSSPPRAIQRRPSTDRSTPRMEVVSGGCVCNADSMRLCSDDSPGGRGRCILNEVVAAVECGTSPAVGSLADGSAVFAKGGRSCRGNKHQKGAAGRCACLRPVVHHGVSRNCRGSLSRS